MPSEDPPSVDRRSVLRTIGAGAALSTTTTLGGVLSPDDRQFRHDIERARRLRADRDSYEAFIRYLRDQGYAVSRASARPQALTTESAPTETMRLSESDLRAELSMTAYHTQCDPDPNKIYIEYWFEWDVDSGHGEPEEDWFSYSWDQDEMTYIEDTHQSSNNVTFQKRSDNLNGIAFSFDDTSLDSGSLAHGYGGCYAEPDSELNQDTSVGGKYAHTYKETKICDATYDPDGAHSIKTCDKDRKDMMGHVSMKYEEADHNYNNC
jgi:hypothetical protein